MAAIVGAFLNNRRKERIYRHFSINMNCDNTEMRRRYRFDNNGIEIIVQLLARDLQRKTKRSEAVSVREQVVCDSTGRDKSTVSRIISNVTDSMVDISHQFITWPNRVQQQEIMREFFTSAGFPNVIGAVDGSHIRIIMPKDGHDFINRKNFASINVVQYLVQKSTNKNVS
ncbi:putative nuclease HARBI1 [Mya arenaria]|uniref:putative nuclease HARBI1 n=1 Tax=Mya arenaria TaxID=6604 RepID=UPI0022E4B7CE|nr:putative nuclease HARBI1 [Mya arenaria]